MIEVELREGEGLRAYRIADRAIELQPAPTIRLVARDGLGNERNLADLLPGDLIEVHDPDGSTRAGTWVQLAELVR